MNVQTITSDNTNIPMLYFNKTTDHDILFVNEDKNIILSNI